MMAEALAEALVEAMVEMIVEVVMMVGANGHAVSEKNRAGLKARRKKTSES
jgi:hypothetical protein